MRRVDIQFDDFVIFGGSVNVGVEAEKRQQILDIFLSKQNRLLEAIVSCCFSNRGHRRLRRAGFFDLAALFLLWSRRREASAADSSFSGLVAAFTATAGP